LKLDLMLLQSFLNWFWSGWYRTFIMFYRQTAWVKFGFCEQNSGEMVPLDTIVRLKEKYLFRVLVDESNSIGVLGKTGRGLSEHFNIPVHHCTHLVTILCLWTVDCKFTQYCNTILLNDHTDAKVDKAFLKLAIGPWQVEKIDIITSAMGHSLASVGGFCTGSAKVVDHQVCLLTLGLFQY
jgi:serine palmitoyltransferase